MHADYDLKMKIEITAVQSRAEARVTIQKIRFFDFSSLE